MMKRMMLRAAWQGNQKARLLVSIAHNITHITGIQVAVDGKCSARCSVMCF